MPPYVHADKGQHSILYTAQPSWPCQPPHRHTHHGRRQPTRTTDELKRINTNFSRAVVSHVRSANTLLSPADGGRCHRAGDQKVKVSLKNKAVIQQARYAFRPSAATLPYGLTYCTTTALHLYCLTSSTASPKRRSSRLATWRRLPESRHLGWGGVRV